MSNKYPHVPAAWINQVAENSTKGELIQYLQETWNELCYWKSKHSDSSWDDRQPIHDSYGQFVGWTP